MCPDTALSGNTACVPYALTGYPGTKCGGNITCNLDTAGVPATHCVKGYCTGNAKGASCSVS